MADFQTSTHRSKWIFTPQDLAVKREATNQRAVKMLEEYGVTRLGVDVDGSISYPETLNGRNNNAGRHSLPKALNCEEELLMRVYYEHKIQEVCRAFGFPHKIQGTAILYFKRFYLHWSVMEHHPKHIMLTCIYASCKVEENHVSAEELGKGIQQDHQMILNNEMVVFQSLGFDLIVYAPYRSIEGFYEDMEEFCQARNDEQEKLKGFRETVKSEVDKIMLTDAPLLFPPGQLALAGLRRSNAVHRVVDFERYLKSLFSRQPTGHTISELAESLTAIDLLTASCSVQVTSGSIEVALFQAGKLTIHTTEDMKNIDRKLKSCWDPSSLDGNKKREKRSKHKSKRTAGKIEGGPA